MQKIPQHQGKNPLDLISDKIDDNLKATAAKTIEDIAGKVPEIMTRMYEEDFVRNYLPLFYYDPDNVLNRKWLEISTSMMLGVILVDRDDNEVYQVPPFMPTVLPSRDMQSLPIANMAGNMEIALSNNRGYQVTEDAHKIVNGLSANTKLVDHDELWNAFYDRYNSYISITDQDGNDLLKPRKKTTETNKNIHIDF